MRNDIARRVGEVSVSAPSPDLRARVLAAAAPLVEPRVTWSDRIWFSRGWRLAAAGLFAALLALQWWPWSTPGAASPESVDPARAAIAVEARQIAAEFNLTEEQRTLLEQDLLHRLEVKRREWRSPALDTEGGS